MAGFILTFPTISNSHLGHGYGTNPGPWTLFGNLDSGNIVPGQWHRVERSVELSTSPTLPECVLRWWIDGVLIGQYCTVNFDSAAFNEIKFSPS